MIYERYVICEKTRGKLVLLFQKCEVHILINQLKMAKCDRDKERNEMEVLLNKTK